MVGKQELERPEFQLLNFLLARIQEQFRQSTRATWRQHVKVNLPKFPELRRAL
jgi:hypothetical protein